ncbi:hypothetical protein HK107_11840 [Parvularcula sp. ZS-1/3]|uniref:VTT domain-containing protein n=1 Tax=Parvularcula mediterranea TaxID=2732508 RepID=A0A7Y3RMV3_9PROT|nr:VTT domain-containing protein [Parvularcula mediterranea]NNU17012.1 hypothetical protein [Parvularcula mediterranea]
MDAGALTEASQAMQGHLWAVYLGIFFGPFVQEDAAVIGGASLAAAGMVGQPLAVLIVLLAGLSVSDLWKYWIGAAARTHPWARKQAEGPRVRKAGELCRNRLGQAVFVARFVPGTRIALYIAAGYFKAPFPRFAVFIVASAILLIGAVYLLLKLLGELIGDRAIFIVSLGMLSVLAVFILAKVIASRLSRRKTAA